MMNQLRNTRIFSTACWQPLFSRIKSPVWRLETSGQLVHHRNTIFVTLNLSVRKGYATDATRRAIPKRFKKPLLPFETQTSAFNDILLFSYHQKERLCRMVSFGGVFLFLVLLNSSELTYRYLGHFKTASPDENYPWYYWWKFINFDSKAIKYGAAGFIACFAFVVLAFALAYPTRMVREITLLKGGEKILLQTYRPFGLVKSQEVSLSDVSAQWGPAEAEHYLPLKIRGKKVPLLVNQDGRYHNRRLFDQTVGLYRF